MNHQQLCAAVADLREMLNEVYNEHSEMKEQLRELRVKAGIETSELAKAVQRFKKTSNPTPS